MGYCQPNWISDYTYAGLFKRVAYVRKTTTGKSYVGNGAPAASNVFRTLRVPGDGKARWLSRTVRIPSTSDGATKVVEFIDGAGQTMGTAAVLVQELDHLPGAQVFVPPRFWGARSVRYAGEALAIDL